MSAATGTEEVQPDIRVRRGTLDDLEVFLEYSCRLAFETENKVLDRERTRAAITKGIQSPKIGEYFIAWDENDPEKKPIATMMCTKEISFQLGGLIQWI